MRSYCLPRTLCLSLFAAFTVTAGGNNYKTFDVALYSRVYETQQMKDPAWLESRWAAVTKNMKVDKIYLETHRDTVVVDQATLDIAKKFFLDKGVKVAGGITITISERNQFETYCYSNPEHRAMLRKVVEFTARNFDEFILDDFFFTDCKADSDIAAKGTRSWTRFRLDQMDEAARNLIIKPAKNRQSEGQNRHQIPQLVRPLPEPRLQPRDRTAHLRRPLHRHRNPRSQWQSASAAVPRLLSDALL
jgi:hypothetical protein